MEQFIVALIVGTALVALLRRYLPMPARRMIANTLARRAKQFGMAGLSSRLAREAVVAASCADGCGGCGGCGSTAAPTAPARSSISVDALRRTARK